MFFTRLNASILQWFNENHEQPGPGKTDSKKQRKTLASSGQTEEEPGEVSNVAIDTPKTDMTRTKMGGLKVWLTKYRKAAVTFLRK